MANIDFEGTEVPIKEGDTIAAALYRGGTRIFSRSFKYHRPRGLYCVGGDCPNCLVTVDGEVNVRACECRASVGQKVTRQNAWPSADRDALAVIDRFHWALPVGFYYKAGIKPKFAWPHDRADDPQDGGSRRRRLGATRRATWSASNWHPDVLVVGAGVAGLSAAIAAAGDGRSVMLIDETRARRARRARADEGRASTRCAREVDANAAITTSWNTPATGLFEGPLLIALCGDETYHIHPQAIVIACGGREIHRVFTQNDLPGVMLARGAARLAGVHGVQPGNRAVVWAEQPEALEHVRTLAAAGVEIAAVVAPEGLDTTRRRGRGDPRRGHRRDRQEAPQGRRRRRPHDRLRPARDRLRDPGQRAPRPARLRPAGRRRRRRGRRGRDAGRGRRQRHRRRPRRRRRAGAVRGRRRPPRAPAAPTAPSACARTSRSRTSSSRSTRASSRPSC